MSYFSSSLHLVISSTLQRRGSPLLWLGPLISLLEEVLFAVKRSSSVMRMRPWIQVWYYLPAMPLRVWSWIKALWKMLTWLLLWTHRGFGEDSWAYTSWAATKGSCRPKRCPGKALFTGSHIYVLLQSNLFLNIFGVYTSIWFVFHFEIDFTCVITGS